MNIAQIPVAEALFQQWVKARGAKRPAATSDFIRRWHHIEDDPFFAEVTEAETLRDLRDLAASGWLVVVPEKRYRHRIAQVRIPLDKEAAWQNAFGFAGLDHSDAERIAAWPWTAQLAFLKTARISVSFDELKRLDEYIQAKFSRAIQLPIKERSIQIFGDEKRLDELYRGSLLFKEGHLDLDDLDCYLVPEPLAWIRGKRPNGPIVVLENAATWDSFRRWDTMSPRYSAIVYGGGDRFRECARRMDEIFEEVGGLRETFYFGDLDAAGLRIPRIAADIFLSLGWPRLKPDLESYSKLIALSATVPDLKRWNGLAKPAQKDIDWLEPLGAQAEPLILKYGRIAQEWLSFEYLSS
jgi:hypothetical protein